MKNAIKNRKGEGYIDTAVGVVCAMMVIVLALNVFSFLTLKQDLDYINKELTKTVCFYGKTGTEVNERYEELCDEIGIRPTMEFTGTDFFNSTKGTVQLGDLIVVRLKYSTYVRGLGVFQIPITLTTVQSGLSEKYWK